ncbi:MAG TPA: serine hydrolase [Candidatus Paceibacterota bacterium]|nr:serine hydrolase [Candidatus Paceibacterota bacterium]
MSQPQNRKPTLPWYKTAPPWIAAGIIGIAAFLAGWLLPLPNLRLPAPPRSLRLSGYQFIDPLLVCNANNSRIFPEDQPVNGAIQSIINSDVRSGDLSKASAYFVDLANGKWADVDPGSQFYPSSLGKIPIMMAYYEMAENDPTILDKTITYPAGSADLNDSQDIKPAQAIVPGQTYTVEQLIEYMVEYSDNNATQLLFSNVDQDSLDNVYRDLNIPTISNVTEANADAVTPQQISYLFRVLYNATYISRDYSEKALELMSQSSFTQGIVAGLPSSTVVSHKLGLVGITNGGVTTEHELHDCGIVYARDPYILCVMTRGSSTLTTMEGVIADISKAAYGQVENGN